MLLLDRTGMGRSGGAGQVVGSDWASGCVLISSGQIRIVPAGLCYKFRLVWRVAGHSVGSDWAPVGPAGFCESLGLG